MKTTIDLPKQVEDESVRSAARFYVTDDNDFANLMIDCYLGVDGAITAQKYDIPKAVVTELMELITSE